VVAVVGAVMGSGYASIRTHNTDSQPLAFSFTEIRYNNYLHSIIYVVAVVGAVMGSGYASIRTHNTNSHSLTTAFTEFRYLYYLH
jgi:hypothetical protein